MRSSTISFPQGRAGSPPRGSYQFQRRRLSVRRRHAARLSRKIYRYDATTGAFVDVIRLRPCWHQSSRGEWLAFAPSGEFYVSQGGPTGLSGSYVARFAPSSFAAFTVSLSQASPSAVSVDFTTADGTALAGSDYTATCGTLTFAPGETTRTILVPTLDDAVAEPTETFTVNLSNPTGGDDRQRPGRRHDPRHDDQVLRGRRRQPGPDLPVRRRRHALGNNALSSGDTAPRGVATTAAGTTVWVVDANKNVYVYNTSGALLGSWSAGGLSPSTPSSTASPPTAPTSGWWIATATRSTSTPAPPAASPAARMRPAASASSAARTATPTPRTS